MRRNHGDQEETKMNMSLDVTARPNRTAPEELVPSRYALRVGEIEVLVISDGVLPQPAETIATNGDPAEMAAWLDNMRLRPDEFKWPLNVVVVRSGDQTVLIDSGVGTEFHSPRSGHLARRMEAAGIDPASITDVVLTHMHVDHIGGLLADGLMGRLRPEVPIHLAAAEVAFWAAPDFPPFMPAPVRDVLGPVAGRFLDKYRGQLKLFEERHEVAPGVTVNRTGGHTPGHSVVRMASGDGRLTFLGDSVFQNHFERPDWFNAFDHDPEEAVRVRTRLLRELAASRELLVAAHVSFPFGRVATAGEVFRFIPAYWEY
jgi:glyoxylase-like metal-dependent hydrolase (beta-lactamase superfamily II)